MNNRIVIKSLAVISIAIVIISAIPYSAKALLVRNLETKGYNTQINHCSYTWGGFKCQDILLNKNGTLNLASRYLYVLPRIKGNHHVLFVEGDIEYKRTTSSEISDHKLGLNLEVRSINLKLTSNSHQMNFTSMSGLVYPQKNFEFKELSIKNEKGSLIAIKGSVNDDNIVIGKVIISKQALPRLSKLNQENGKPLFPYHVKVSDLEAEIYDSKIRAQNIEYQKNNVKAEKIELVHEDLTVGSNFLEFAKSDSYDIKAKLAYLQYKPISKTSLEFNDISLNIIKKDESYEFKSNALGVNLTGEIRNTPEVVVHINLEETSCQALLDVAPTAMKEFVTEIKFTGSMSLDAEVNLTNPDAQIKFINQCKSINAGGIYSRQTLKDKFTRMVLDENGNEKQEVAGPNTPGWIHLHDISKYAVYAAVSREDPGFYGHRGILIQAIENSIKDNLKRGKFLRGGSTISMQTAKNLWLNRSKTLSRKFQEIFLTTHLEQILTKSEIMETYLNIAEFYPGNYGILKGAKHYFNIYPHELSITQAAFLISMLPSPKTIAWREDGRVTDARMALIRLIISNMSKRGWVSEDEIKESETEWVVIGKSIPEHIEENDPNSLKYVDKDW